MSTPATVPMFAPDGTLGDIPYEKMMDAKNAGAKPAVKLQAPDGSTGYIPADKIADATKAGGKLLPIEQQDTQHPGFWHALYGDLSSLASGVVHSDINPIHGMTETKEDVTNARKQEEANAAASEAAKNSPERQAHGAIYRNVTVPAAEAIGTNVAGMEQSAAEGDIAGVAGHATAPAVVAGAPEGVARGIPAIKNALPNASRAAEGLENVTRAAAGHPVAVTPGLSRELLEY